VTKKGALIGSAAVIGIISIFAGLPFCFAITGSWLQESSANLAAQQAFEAANTSYRYLSIYTVPTRLRLGNKRRDACLRE